MNTENRYQETDLGNVSPNPRGEYTPGTEYEYLDLVTFDGGSYICTAELGATTSISPESGKTTDFWQCMTIPGDMTPEYVAMHDRVVNLSEQVEADAEEVRTAEQNVSGMKENVTQMQEQTRQYAESAEQSKDSAAGYAASADISRRAAETSEQNINAQVTGFDAHVAEKTSESEQSIEAARIAANKAILAQQEQSVGEVARVGGAAVSEAQTAARVATEKASEASTSEKNAKASETATKNSETNVTRMAEQVAKDKEQVSSDRTAVEEAKQEMTEKAEQIGQNTQDVAVLKKNVKELNDKKITKFYASNLGNTTLNDSDNGKITDMMLYGKSFQQTYTGKNLLCFEPRTTTVNGVTLTSNSDGSVTINGTNTGIVNIAIPLKTVNLSGTYVLSGYNKDMALQLYYKNSEGTILYTYFKGSTPFTVEECTTLQLFLFIDANEAFTYNNEKFYVQLESGTEATSYEPYVGGIPSPNPDYPQEIKSVVNPVVNVTGKNLIPKWHQGMIDVGNGTYIDSLNLNWLCAEEYVKIDQSKTYTLSADSNCRATVYEYNNYKKFIRIKQPLKSVNYNTYKPSVDCEYVRFGYNYSDSSEVIAPNDMGIKHYLQLEIGPTATPYEPYTEQLVTLPYTLNAIPVSSGGNVTIDGQQYIADYVDVEKKQLVRCVRKRALAKYSYLPNKGLGTNGEYHYICSDYPSDALKTLIGTMHNAYKSFMCENTRVVKQTDEGKYAENVISVFGHNEKVEIRPRPLVDDYPTLEELNNYLSSTIVLYPIEPITIDLTDEEIIEFKALATHYPTTNIFVTSDQLDGYTTLNYPLNMKNGWDYVKEQLGDTRDYIYDMELQSMEAYVNSEYAVTLAELEV